MSAESSPQDDKKNVEQLVDHINLKVVAQDGSVVQFKTKKTNPLKKLMKTYCERKNLAMANVRFRFDGDAINVNSTPKELGMEEGDAIEIFQEQSGGGIESRFRPLTKWWTLLQQTKIPIVIHEF